VSFGFDVRPETDIDNVANFETTTLARYLILTSITPMTDRRAKASVPIPKFALIALSNSRLISES
jgi:hypothetical protein